MFLEHFNKYRYLQTIITLFCYCVLFTSSSIMKIKVLPLPLRKNRYLCEVAKLTEKKRDMTHGTDCHSTVPY